MSEAAALAWLLKVQETEALLRDKQAALAEQLLRQHELEEQHRQQTDANLELRCELLEAQENLARLKRHTLRSTRKVDRMMEVAEDRQWLLLAQETHQHVQAQAKEIADVARLEAARMQKWQDTCCDAEGPLKEHVLADRKVQTLRKRLQQVEARVMPALRKELDSAPLQAQLESEQAALVTVQEAASAAKAREDNLRARLADLTQAATAAEARLSTARAAADARRLRSQVDMARQDLASLQSQLEGMEAWLQTLRGPKS